MKKRSTLLKVISILMIIGGVIGCISGIATFFMKDSLAEGYALLGMEAPGTGYYVFSILSSIVELAAGVMGVMYRSRQSVLVIGGIWTVFVIIGMVYSAMITGFAPTVLLSLLFPILYLWGWYQSN